MFLKLPRIVRFSLNKGMLSFLHARANIPSLSLPGKIITSHSFNLAVTATPEEIPPIRSPQKLHCNARFIGIVSF